MTTNLPLSSGRSDAAPSFMAESGNSGDDRFRKNGGETPPGAPGMWTGTREGIVSTVIALLGAVIFGGAASAWFAPGEAGLMGQALMISGGTLAMGALVSLFGSLLAGRNPIFWGVGMPLLVYITGTVFAIISGHAGAATLFFGAPLFAGLGIAAGVMTAFLIDRDQ